MLTFAFSTQSVEIVETICIRADGSVVPSTAPIQRDGDVYTFAEDINVLISIIVERNNITIDGNGHTLQGLGLADTFGLYLHNMSNVTIQNLEIINYQFGILLEDSSNNTICHNKVMYCTVGIRLVSSSNNIIFGNNITAHGYAGITLGGFIGSSNNVISGNNITNNYYGIIRYSSSNSNIISDNNITNNSYGIWLEFSSNNSVSGNNITNNLRGLFLGWGSNDNIISGNNIENNGDGIYLSDSSNNSIYHNNFINNTLQVHDMSWEQPYIPPSTNIWNNDYPSGGNYWSDL